MVVISIWWSSQAFTKEALRASLAAFGRDLAGNPKEVVLVLLSIALAVEGGFFVLAFLFMPWGAVDEPLRARFSHALRRVWCQSPHVLLVIVLVGLLSATLDRMNQAWAVVHPVTYPQMPQPPPGLQPNTPQSDAFDQLMDDYYDEHSRIWSAARAAKPWYLRNDEPLAVSVGFLCGLWFLVALLRAVGIPRPQPPVTRSPCCEGCGYDLTLMPLERRCPECGDPVAVSLGPQVRPGSPWQQREPSMLAAWWQTTRLAISDPAALGRMLRMREPGTGHRTFLLLHLPLVFLIGCGSLPALALALRAIVPEIPTGPPNVEVLAVSTVFGIVCTVGVLFMTLATASRRGVVHQLRDKRNVLPGAIQASCYLTGYLVCWQVFGAAAAISAIVLGNHPEFRGYFEGKRIGPEFAAFLLWVIPNLLWALVYLRLARMGIAATRYANR